MIKNSVLMIALFLGISVASYAQFPTIGKVKSKHPRLSREVLSDIIGSLPNPLEISVFAQQQKIDYQKTKLPAKANGYLHQAWLSGVYFVRLHQACVYKKTEMAKAYLKAMQRLATTLSAAQYFPESKLKVLLKKNKKQGEFLSRINQSYEGLSYHWQIMGYADASIMMATGDFIESLYLLASSVSNVRKQTFWNRLRDQKIMLEQYLLLLSFYEESPEVKKVILALNELQLLFDQVKIDFEYQEPSLNYVNDMILAQDNTKTRIYIEEGTKRKLVNKIKEIRKRLMPQD
ncbi:hypothetical protein BKI52_34170 [marine bacterium AO1-C]|nr:hypothetical protein BKI52_34170 [marine bacterium AO1-C]